MRSAVMIIATAVLLLPAGVNAQEIPRDMGGREGRVRQSTIEWLLETQKTQFRPTAEQVAKLQEIQKRLDEQTATHREEMQKVREAARSSNGDRRAGFEKFRPMMEEMRKLDEQATQDALAVLNDEQKKVVGELLEKRKQEMQNRRGRMGDPRNRS